MARDPFPFPPRTLGKALGQRLRTAFKATALSPTRPATGRIFVVGRLESLKRGFGRVLHLGKASRGSSAERERMLSVHAAGWGLVGR